MSKNFSDFQLAPQITENIQKLGFNECTPIQEDAIPLVLKGQDVAGLAQTGTGKTAAYLIPLLHRILSGEFTEWKARQFVLVLVPTRELAEQVLESFIKLSEGTGMRGAAIYGGVGYEKQKEALAQGYEFIFATPGRLIDLYKEHVADLKQVRAVVFDEADRLFDMGFKDDIRYVLQRIPRERQMLVFSATLNLDVINTCYEFGSHPVELNLSRDKATAENVHHVIMHVGQEEKPMYLLSILKMQNARQVIVFTNFKNQVERVADFLTKNGLPAMAISSLMTQAQRNKVIQKFKEENHLNILVATDLAARGLDIKGVDLVINFDLPQDSETYVHRIGRTGRAGETGKATSMVSDRDVDSLVRIEEFLKQKLETAYLEDTQLLKDFAPYIEEDRRPRHHDRGGNRGGGGGRRDQRDGQRQGGRRNDRQQRPHHDRGQQAQGGGQNPQGGQQQRASGENQQRRDRPQQRGGQQNRHRDQQHPRSSHPKQGRQQQQHRNGPRPKSQHQRTPPPAASLTDKVVGFFKGLFR